MGAFYHSVIQIFLSCTNIIWNISEQHENQSLKHYFSFYLLLSFDRYLLISWELFQDHLQLWSFWGDFRDP